ncbi:MAG: glycogen synthase [Bacteroidetes bacterium HGW-Bacteroidetes-21]|jgi:starch synthase|nr:MAG: glycogen synthase [Bacteroidetes bacterium HGW-Bacteroidetes-21]
MEKERVLFITQEITPYLPESPMSLIGRYLPQGIQEKGREIRTFTARFGNINERRNQLHEVIRLSGINIIINESDHPLTIKVASIQSARMQVYFIDNEDYFQRKFSLSDDHNNTFEDNDERAIFFARGVLETVKKLRWSPHVVHCHGWFSAAVPLYIKKAFREDPLFHESKVIYSIYNDEFPGSLNKNFKKKAIIEGVTPADLKVADDPTYVNLMKLAINMSDGIILASPDVNPEIKNYLKKIDKPVLDYVDETVYLDEYATFYDLVLSKTFVES